MSNDEEHTDEDLTRLASRVDGERDDFTRLAQRAEPTGDFTRLAQRAEPTGDFTRLSERPPLQTENGAPEANIPHSLSVTASGQVVYDPGRDGILLSKYGPEAEADHRIPYPPPPVPGVVTPSTPLAQAQELASLQRGYARGTRNRMAAFAASMTVVAVGAVTAIVILGSTF